MSNKNSDKIELEAKVRGLLKTKSKLTVSTLQVVNIGRVKTKFGPRWPRLRDKAFAIASSIIRQMIHPDEICMEFKYEGFVLILEADDDETGFNRSVEVCREIKDRLIGNANDSDFMFFKVTTVDCTANNVDHISKIVSELSPPAYNAEPHHAAPSWDRTKTTLQDTSNQDARPSDRLVLHFEPIWRGRDSVVIGNRILMMRATSYGQFYGLKALHGGYSDPLMPEFFAKYFSDVQNLLAGSEPLEGQISLPVPYALMTDRKLCSSSGPWRELSDSIHELKSFKNIIFEIFAIEENINKTIFEKMLNYIGENNINIIFESMKFDQLFNYKNNILKNNIFYLNLLADNEHLTLIREFSNHWKSRQARIGINNVNSIKDFELACMSGYDFISGAVIGAPQPKPSKVHKLRERVLIIG